ncbi:cilia- and flagella-associated 46-like, partial [Brachionus plicatilis]
SLIQYLRGEGIELFEKPRPPVADDSTTHKFAKLADQSESEMDSTKSNIKKRDFANDQEWKEYCEWLNRLCKEAVDNFLQGIKIGIELRESWLVCQGSAYLWNYFHHLIEKRQNNHIVSILTEIFDAIKKVGHDTEAELLVSICVALSTGLMQNWLPPDHVKPLQIPIVSDINTDKKKQAINAATKPIVIPPEAGGEFKKALEVCEYAMMVTNGDDLKDVVGLNARSPLIKNWVLAKQFTQSAIKNFGLNKVNERIQDKYTKCMVGVEILNRNFKVSGQNSYEIKEPPGVKELIGYVDSAQPWPDKLVELELWSNLCVLANRANQTDNLRYCYSRALESVSYFEKKKSESKKIYLKSQFLLSEACLALGEHLAFILNNPNTSPIASSSKQNLDQSQNSNVSNASKDIRVALRRSALNGFADAALYASNAENYDYVVHAARHYWNLCLPYLAQPQERATLYENLTEMLSSWTNVYKFKPKESANNVETVKIEVKKEETHAKSAKSAKSNKSSKESVKVAKEEPKADSGQEVGSSGENSSDLDDAFDDLTLRCVLYACLFQITLDKNQYEEALEQMEMALNDLPRTKHRLLIYRFKVITKSKLGMDVQMDLQKFREESEKNLAQMYRKVALSSIKNSDTIKSYQRAIETLSENKNLAKQKQK